MSNDPRVILGLSSGDCSPAEIDRRFIARRRELRLALDDPGRYEEARGELEELYQAYRALRSPASDAAPIRMAEPTDAAAERIEYLRRLIEVSLEGGLLRYSRRREVLAEGLRLGYSEFHTQLLIAQTQFGGEVFAPPAADERAAKTDAGERIGARVAAVGVLALALFLAMVRWLGA